MFKKEIFEKLNLESRPIGWVVAFEMAIKAQLAGLQLGEVPIVSIDRLYGGRSTFHLGPWFVEYLKWFIWGARRLATARRTRRREIALPGRNLAVGMGSVRSTIV